MAHSHSPVPTFSDAVQFHGHKCPGLALGYRAARLALEELRSDPSQDEELVAIVENDACGIDALQVVTGCTAGKGNLVFRDYGKHVYTLVNRGTGNAIRVTTNPGFSTARIDPAFGELREKAMQGRATAEERAEFERHLDAVCQAILTLPAGEIFSVRHERVEVPPLAKIHRSVPCDSCGEMVSEHRVVRHGNKVLCIPCSEKKE